MNSYTFTHEVPVPPDAVWDVVADHPGIARWTLFRRVVMEAGGRTDPHGVGAVRALHLAGPPIREEITAFEPGRRLEYRLLSGLPARDYTGEVLLEPTGTGTRVRWSIRFTPAFPGAQIPVSIGVRYIARSLAQEVNRRAGSAASGPAADRPSGGTTS